MMIGAVIGNMDNFPQARKLFSEFQKSRKYSDLEEALDILDELLLGDDRKRAENLKATIDRFFNDVRIQLLEKYNIRDFESPTNDALNLLVNSVSEYDSISLQNLMSFYIRPILSKENSK